MLLAELAVFCHLNSVGVVLLVFLGVVVALFALCTRKRNFNSHFSAPPIFLPLRALASLVCLDLLSQLGFISCAKRHKKINPY